MIWLLYNLQRKHGCEALLCEGVCPVTPQAWDEMTLETQAGGSGTHSVSGLQVSTTTPHGLVIRHKLLDLPCLNLALCSTGLIVPPLPVVTRVCQWHDAVRGLNAAGGW